MLETKNIKYAYKGQPQLQFPDITCQQGEQWLLLGQSGCGKTTLLHLLGGLMPPQEGEIKINNTSIGSLSQSALDQFRGKNIGIIFQQSHFVKAITVEENLALAQNLAGVSINKRRIHSILEQLNLGHKLDAKPNNLSQGEQQRVAIARAIINQPSVILADEPTSALDDKNCTEVVKLLEQQAKESNAALLIVTHDTRLKALIPNQIEL